MRKVRVRSKAINKEIEVGREIGRVGGVEPGPIVIMTGGIHGNEPSGVFALRSVLDEIKEKNIPVKGSIIAFTGNLNALSKGIRYKEMDLNRLWVTNRVEKALNEGLSPEEINEDVAEFKGLLDCFSEVFDSYDGPYYFLDLHTTSSESAPFLTVGDTITNRKFAQKYPLPIILGIEEHLDGPMLNWINELGHISIGFEAGQHDSPKSIEYHAAFTWLTLVNTGSIPAELVPNFDEKYQLLRAAAEYRRRVFEIRFRYDILPGERFTMKLGYTNFQPIVKGEMLAVSNGKDVKAREKGRIFLPLYQEQGSDGFFEVREIRTFWLGVSEFLRRMRFDAVLTLLPGIKRDPKEKNILLVNLKIAKFFTTEIFHLLGFRQMKKRANKVAFIKRKYDLEVPPPKKK